MRSVSWIAVAILIAVFLWAAFDVKAMEYPYRAIGAYRGTPVSVYAGTVTADHYMSLESPVGTDYQVPAGQTLRITHVLYESATGGSMVIIGYGSDAVAVGAAAPTGATSLIGAHGASPVSPLAAETAASSYALDVYAEVPASQFPFIQASGANTRVQIFGVVR